MRIMLSLLVTVWEPLTPLWHLKLLVQLSLQSPNIQVSVDLSDHLLLQTPGCQTIWPGLWLRTQSCSPLHIMMVHSGQLLTLPSSSMDVTTRLLLLLLKRNKKMLSHTLSFNSPKKLALKIKTENHSQMVDTTVQ